MLFIHTLCFNQSSLKVQVSRQMANVQTRNLNSILLGYLTEFPVFENIPPLVAYKDKKLSLGNIYWSLQRWVVKIPRVTCLVFNFTNNAVKCFIYFFTNIMKNAFNFFKIAGHWKMASHTDLRARRGRGNGVQIPIALREVQVWSL